MAPKKRRGFAVVLVLLALVALVCCGAVGYGGWWQPRQKLAQNERVLEQMGVPKGFQDSPVRNPAGTTDVFTEYFLLCKNAVCPVQPAGAIHEWLRYNEAPADRKVVESCLHWAAQPNPQPCRFQWAGNGWRVEVTAVWQVAQGQADEDREWKVRATVYAD